MRLPSTISGRARGEWAAPNQFHCGRENAGGDPRFLQELPTTFAEPRSPRAPCLRDAENVDADGVGARRSRGRDAGAGAWGFRSIAVEDSGGRIHELPLVTRLLSLCCAATFRPRIALDARRCASFVCALRPLEPAFRTRTRPALYVFAYAAIRIHSEHTVLPLGSHGPRFVHGKGRSRLRKTERNESAR